MVKHKRRFVEDDIMAKKSIKKSKLKVWKNKNGRVQYPLPNCKICGKRSNTTDKETAQIAARKDRIYQQCTKELPERLDERRNTMKEMKTKKSIWQKIKRLFK